MASPADHYRAAEALLDRADDHGVDSPEERSVLSYAKVHLLAAQVGLTAMSNYSMDDRDDWQAVFAGYQLGEPEVTR